MADQIDSGAFLALNEILDTDQILALDVQSKEFKEFIVSLREAIDQITSMTNIKISGQYALTEFVNGKRYFPDQTLAATANYEPVDRMVYRIVIDFGALPNATTKSVAHGVTTSSTFVLTNLYAAATTPSTSYIPIPYASPTLSENIAIYADGTNVTIKTGSNRTAYTTCWVVMEYIKG